MKDFLKKYPQALLYAIFGLSLAAMIGSLYYSNYGDPIANIAGGAVFPYPAFGFVPCLLCWYSRILMYPIVPLSLVGIIKKDRHASWYILPLSILGIVLSLYHYSLQMFQAPDLFHCSAFAPCGETQVKYLSFVTIPLLGFVAYGVITVCALLYNVTEDQYTRRLATFFRSSYSRVREWLK